MKRQLAIFSAAILATSTLVACVGSDDSEAEELGVAEQGVGGAGTNDLLPAAVDTRPLARGTTNSYSITSSTNADPIPLCNGSTLTTTSCKLAKEWEDWMGGDATNRQSMMKALVKCAFGSAFTVSNHDGALTFAGQWSLYASWADHNLDGNDKRERMSSCVLSLLNGNGATLLLGIVGPGDAPFSDAPTNGTIDLREAGFFGNLFETNPKAYVVGPQTSTMLDTGRACTSSAGTSYCCAEGDMMCPHHIYKAGSFSGTNSRCRSTSTVTNATTGKSYTYCNEFYSTMEPGRSYTNVFTTFVPSSP